MPPARVARWFRRAFAAIARLAPPGSGVDDDAVETFAAACDEVAASRGRWAATRFGVTECATVAIEVARLRTGRLASISAPAPAHPHHERSSSMSRLVRDLRTARRSLLATPSVTILIVVTLAIGVGLATAVFSVLDSVLWHPVPYRDADRLVELAHFNTRQKFSFNGQFSPALLTAWRGEHEVFDRVEAFDDTSLVYRTGRGDEMVAGAFVSTGFLDLLGVPTRLGRPFTAADGHPDTAHIAVVSDRFWRRELGQDGVLTGRAIMLDEEMYQVVGVMPDDFRFPSSATDVWLPIALTDVPPTRAGLHFTPLARLQAGVSFSKANERVQADGAAIAASVGEQSPLAPVGARAADPVTATLLSLGNFVDPKTERSLWVLAAAVGFLLLVVVANVINLALARALGRGRDLAIRAALGASRADLLRGAVAEGGLIALAGLTGAWAVAMLFTRAAVAVLPDAMTVTTFNAIDLDARALACGAVVTLLGVAAFTVPSAIVGSRRAVASLIGSRTRGGTTSLAARRLRAVLVVTEVMVAVVLLVGAALMTRSFLKLEAAPKGFDPAHLVSVRVGLPLPGYQDVAVRNQFVGDAVTQLAHIPGVSAATTGGLPLRGESGMIAVGQAEFAQAPGQQTERLIVAMFEVPSGYFEALRLPLVAGRTFAASDPAGSVIVNEGFARAHFPPGAAIGGRFNLDHGPWRTIIGVAGDTRPFSADQGGQPLQFYYPIGQAPNAFRSVDRASAIADQRTFLIRASEPATVIPAVVAAIHAIDPRVVIWKTVLVEHQYANAIARPRVVMLLMAVFAASGLLLAAAGLYGVLSHLVSQRLREVGIRLALGARPADVGRLVMVNGLWLTVIGLGSGTALALALTRVMRTLLFDVQPADPLSLAAVVTVLVMASAIASWRPARRAMRVDPVRLLRDE